MGEASFEQSLPAFLRGRFVGDWDAGLFPANQRDDFGLDFGGRRKRSWRDAEETRDIPLILNPDGEAAPGLG